MARRLFCRVGSRRIFLTSSRGLANFLSSAQKRRKKEASPLSLSSPRRNYTTARVLILAKGKQ